MKFLQAREMRTHYNKVIEQLRKDKKIVLTNKGKPVALLTELNEDNFEQRLAQEQWDRFHAVVGEIREESVKLGLNRLTGKEIDAEIKAVRKARRS